MRLAIIATLLVAVLLSIWLSVQFDITLVAIMTSILASLKQFKVVWIFEWLFRFIFIRLPQRVLTALVKLYIIDRETMAWILAKLKQYQDYLRQHHKTKLFVFGVLALIFMGMSAWWIGLWLLVIYEVETVLLMVWRRIWPTLSETAFVQAFASLLNRFAHTRAGRLLGKIDQWLESRLRRTTEKAGRVHKERAVKIVEEVLTGLAMRLPQNQPLPKVAPGHWHLIGSHPRRAGKNDAKPRHGGYRPPSTRPKR